MSLSSSRLGELYRGESNPKIKERLLLILRTEDDRQLPSHVVKELHRSKHGWNTKQVNDIIVKEGRVQYHYTHVCRLLHKWGFKQKMPRKVHVNTASKKEKDAFKKEHRKY